MTCGRVVLVVDDDPDIRESMAGVLGDWGYVPRTACNGREALCVLADLAEANERPCLIFLDMMMPVMSGAEFLEVIDRVRCGEVCEVDAVGVDFDVPVVIVSAHVDHFDGVAAVLKKPFSLECLELLAARFC